MKPYGLTVRAIIGDDAGRLLLVRRVLQSAHFAGEWEFPGGKVEDGENVAQALQREALEELGLEITLDGVAGVTEFELPHVRVVTLCFYAHQTCGEIRLSQEHDRFIWITSGALDTLPLTQSARDALAQMAHHSLSSTIPQHDKL